MDMQGLRSRAGASSPAGVESLEPRSRDESKAQRTDEVPPPPSAASADSQANSFECNICLETPQDPVVTLCGHLFCWACLYRWLRLHAQTNECPVCKAGVEEDKVVPLYGRGKASSDPRKKPVPGAEVPNRPSGRRPEPVRQARQEPAFGLFPGLGGSFASAQFGGLTVSAGFGLFPALFGWHFHANPMFPHGGIPGAYGFGAGQQQQQAPVRNAAAEDQNVFLSRLLFALGTFVLLAIIFAS